MKKISHVLSILNKDIGTDSRLREMIKQEIDNLHISQLIYDVRTTAGLTQIQLAELLGTTHSIVTKLEDANYNGHSLSMLQKIAKAFNMKLSIEFLPA